MLKLTPSDKVADTTPEGVATAKLSREVTTGCFSSASDGLCKLASCKLLLESELYDRLGAGSVTEATCVYGAGGGGGGGAISSAAASDMGADVGGMVSTQGCLPLSFATQAVTELSR